MKLTAALQQIRKLRPGPDGNMDVAKIHLDSWGKASWYDYGSYRTPGLWWEGVLVWEWTRWKHEIRLEEVRWCKTEGRKERSKLVFKNTGQRGVIELERDSVWEEYTLTEEERRHLALMGLKGKEGLTGIEDNRMHEGMQLVIEYGRECVGASWMRRCPPPGCDLAVAFINKNKHGMSRYPARIRTTDTVTVILCRSKNDGGPIVLDEYEIQQKKGEAQFWVGVGSYQEKKRGFYVCIRGTFTLTKHHDIIKIDSEIRIGRVLNTPGYVKSVVCKTSGNMLENILACENRLMNSQISHSAIEKFKLNGHPIPQERINWLTEHHDVMGLNMECNGTYFSDALLPKP